MLDLDGNIVLFVVSFYMTATVKIIAIVCVLFAFSIINAQKLLKLKWKRKQATRCLFMKVIATFCTKKHGIVYYHMSTYLPTYSYYPHSQLQGLIYIVTFATCTKERYNKRAEYIKRHSSDIFISLCSISERRLVIGRRLVTNGRQSATAANGRAAPWRFDAVNDNQGCHLCR